MTKPVQVRSSAFADKITTVGAAVVLITLFGNSANAAGTTHTDLERQLVEQGWRAAPDEAGNVLLHPPGETSTAGPASLPFVAQASTANPPDLQELLRQRGWVIHESPAGTTLQLLIDAPAAVTSRPRNAAYPAGSRADDVYRMLEERGWRVHQDASGNTLLVPVGGSGPSSPDDATASTGTSGESTADFRRAVESTGWRVDAAADGSLVMYPPGSSAAQDPADRPPTSTDSGCPGTVTASVAKGSVSLPITDESVVRGLVQEWLAANYPAGHTVGRLRRINRIYVVSIVDGVPPFLLRNQLIVRTDDGRIISVY